MNVRGHKTIRGSAGGKKKKPCFLLFWRFFLVSDSRKSRSIATAVAGEIGASWKIPLSSIRNLFSISVSPSASSSMISVSSSSAAENLKLGKPRDGKELDGEAVLRRSLEIAENFKRCDL